MARRVLVVLSTLTVALLALTGCSSSTTPSNDPLIRLGSQNASAEAGKTAGSSDMMWYPVEYSYVAGSGLNLDGEPGHIYKLSPKGDPMKVAASVAKVFGVQGTVEKIEETLGAPMPMPATDGSTVTTEPAKELPSEKFVYYQVGSKDWTGPTIQLYWSNTGSWYYNNPGAYAESKPSVGCAAPDMPAEPNVEPGQTLPPVVDCVYEPTLPKNLPSAEQARAQAVKIFTATGLPVSGSDVRVQADDWGVFATASYKVNGQNVGIEWSISWGDGGVISSAAGHAVSVVDMGSFDTISDRDAVKRVGDWRWYGGAASSWYPDMFGSRVPMNDDLVKVDGSVSSGSGTATAEPAPIDTVAPAPGEPGDPSIGIPSPAPTPEKVTVVLEKSARALLTVIDDAGNMWLVPGYVFFDANGGIYPVMSVVPGVIELPEPSVMLR